MNFLEQLDTILAAVVPGCPSAAERGCGPLTDTINGHDGRFFKRRTEQRAGCVRHVVLAEEYSIVRHGDLFQYVTFDPELFVEPGNHRLAKHTRGLWVGAEHGQEDAFELDQRLFVKNYVVEVLASEAGLRQTEFDS